MAVVRNLVDTDTDYVQDGVLYHVNGNQNVLIESADDLEDIAPYYLPGALAHTKGWKAIYELGPDGATWEDMLGGGEET